MVELRACSENDKPEIWGTLFVKVESLGHLQQFLRRKIGEYLYPRSADIPGQSVGVLVTRGRYPVTLARL